MGTPVIGVTGAMGVGKTTFCRYLAEDGGEHLDADTIAKKLMVPGHAAYQPVVEAFGTYITDEQGYIQPDRLAEEVFGDPQQLERLESILHPLVVDRIREKVSQSRKSFYVVDAPLLFEVGLDQLCDWVVVVTAPEDLVHDRMEDRGFTREQIDERRAQQMSEEEKIRRADEVISNRGNQEELKQKARELRERILRRDFTEEVDSNG